MASTSTDHLQGESDGSGQLRTLSPAVETSKNERMKRKRMQSPVVTDYNSEASPIIEMQRFGGWKSTSDRTDESEHISSKTNDGTNASPQNASHTIEDRVAAIERLLTDNQSLLLKLVSAHEPPPPPLPTPTEIYEHARKEAKFTDFHQWDSLYIHGLVLVKDETSRSMRKALPCEPCKAYNRVCIVLTEEDPYREFLFSERNVCCGWCEYATIPRRDTRRVQETFRVDCEEISSSSSYEDYQKETKAKDKQQVNEDPIRMNTYFLGGEGIQREVITSDIAKYLGNNATIRPGTHRDSGSSKETLGYYITASRPPTTAMLADLRASSVEWQALNAMESQTPGRLPDEHSSLKTKNFRPPSGYSYTQDSSNYASNSMNSQSVTACRSGTINSYYGYDHGFPSGNGSTRLCESRLDKSPSPCEEPSPFHNGLSYRYPGNRPALNLI